MNLDHLKNKIAIVGVGYTPQGKVPGRTAISFHCEAVANAIADAGISKNEIDALYAYRHFDALAGDFDLTGYALAEQLGIRPAVISQEYFCTRGWLYEAIGLLTSGLARYFVISYGDNARSGRRSFSACSTVKAEAGTSTPSSRSFKSTCVTFGTASPM